MVKIKAELLGRDVIEIECEQLDPAHVKRVSFVGCYEMMEMMQKMRRHFGLDVNQWPLPEAHDHGSLLLKEVILKLRGQWNYPYEAAELCHCRSVATETVDQAIIAGAHTTEAISRQTSASTSCGTCRPDVQKIIDFRLTKKSAS
jgi:bacterioferritin-associated ferredoxin